MGTAALVVIAMIAGAGLLGWALHRYKSQTEAVVEKGAEVVNSGIDAVKDKVK